MGNKSSLHGQIEELIMSVILPLEEANTSVIHPDWVVKSVGDLMDGENEPSPLRRYTSDRDLRVHVRRLLEKRHDPEKMVDEYIDGQTDDLFSGELFPRYPADRMVNGVKKRVYPLLAELTNTELDVIIARYEKGIAGWQRHNDTLKAYRFSRDAA